MLYIVGPPNLLGEGVLFWFILLELEPEPGFELLFALLLDDPLFLSPCFCEKGVLKTVHLISDDAIIKFQR